MQALQAGGKPAVCAAFHGGHVAPLFFQRLLTHCTRLILAHSPDHKIISEPGTFLGESGVFGGSFFHRFMDKVVDYSLKNTDMESWMGGLRQGKWRWY